MVKLIFEILLIFLIVKLFLALARPSPKKRSAVNRPSSNPSKKPHADAAHREAEELVEDPQCGVFVPRSSAVKGPGGRFFCSEACRDAFAGKKG